MSRVPYRLASLLFLGALAGAALWSASALASVAPPALYEGAIDVASLAWSRGADGALAPSLSDSRPLAETGRPVLAERDLLLLVPADASVGGVEVTPLATHREAVPGSWSLGGSLASSEGTSVRVEHLPFGDGVFPAQWGEFGGSSFLRGFRLVAVRVFPLRALQDAAGAWTSIEVLDRFAVRLLPAAPGAPAPDGAVRACRLAGERARTEADIAGLVANPEALTGYVRADGVDVPVAAGGFAPALTPSLSGSPVVYLIITSEALAAQFQRLADYRTACGMPAVVKTVEWIEANYRHGADLQETIRMFIRDAYTNWGVDYVLLGGDTDVLPPRYVLSTYYPPGGAGTDVPADLYFACLDGNWDADKDAIFAEPYANATDAGDYADLANEIAVGRAPVSTPAAAGVFVDKVMAYEKQPAGAQFADRALFAAEVLFPENYHPGDTIVLDGATFAEEIINNYLTPPACSPMTTARMYESSPLWPGSVPLTRRALIDSLNTGHYGILDQVGHGYFYNMSVGDANFVSADADGLTNGDHLFLLYALNCASGAFDYSCLLERFVQNANGGAVASVGSARAAFPYTANNYQKEFFHQLACLGVHRAGDLMGLSRLPYIGNTFYNTADRWTFINYTLLGDPALAIWTAAPRLATVTAPSSLPLGQQTVSVNVSSGGSAVSGALVSLRKDGDDYANGVTGPTGDVALAYDPILAGSATLTISGAGLAYTERALPVTASGPFIAVDTVTLVDDGTGGTSGNADTRLDAGETVAVWMQYKDTGGGGATGCTATLTGADAGVTIVDGTANVGTVPGGGLKSATEPFLVHVDPTVADGTHLAFTVTVSAAGGGPWSSEWNPTVTAPEIEPVALTWSDAAPFGNNNGVQEAAEKVAVTLSLKNFGAGLSGNLTLRLRTSDPAVTLYDTVATCSSLALLQQGTNAGALSLAEASVTTHHWCRIVITDSWGRTVRHDFQLGSRLTPSGIITDSTLGPDIIALSWTPVTQARQRGYNVYRSTSVSGPFQRANADIIEGISYFRDSGLSFLTPYYYRVTSVDSTLIESPPSPTIQQSTAPPERPGFPLPIGVETSGHLAVGDVNGDGLPEIVLGADEVYVWTASGGELMDGDHNAQTLGPLTGLHGAFTPAGITLADLDGVPGLEIIASERTQNKIHIFRYDGTELPGWPRPLADTSHWNWTTPAVGDIDGDGSPEIVLNAIDGRTYAWHVNGTEVRDGDNNPATTGVLIVRPEAVGEWGWSSPALYDVDGDGKKEIIFGSKLSSNNQLYAYKVNGTQAAGFPISTGYGPIVCSPAVGDLDGDGIAEIVFISDNDSLYVVHQNGTAYPGFPIAFTSNDAAYGISCPSPALGDLNGDGKLEIVAVSTTNTVNANVKVISTNVAAGTSGQVLPGWPRFVPGDSESSPVIGDIDGDNVPDILYGIGGGNESTPNNLYAWKADGTMIAGFPITLGGPIRPAPVICDVDHDGMTNIVYGGWDLQIHNWSMPFAYHPQQVPWGTFHGSNLRDGVYRDQSLTGVTPGATPALAALTLAPNFPNPFNPSTTVRLYLPGAVGQQAPLRLSVFDLQGRLVRTLHDGPAATGWDTWVWDGRDARGRAQASGLYFLRAESGAVVRTQKLALVK